ncbi:MAG TPA: redoxin domain-containing protein [Solirubrobacteraceae bacterium]
MRRYVLPITFSAFGVALLALLIYGISHQSASRTLDEAVAHGHQPLAPQAARSLPILSSAGHSSLSAYRGKVVLLNFWASWCAPCEQEAPMLQSTQRQLLQHGATVLGVTYKDTSSDSAGFVTHYHLTYPNLRDGSGEFARFYGTDQLPESFLINRKGDIVAIERGEIDRSFLNRAVSLAESS